MIIEQAPSNSLLQAIIESQQEIATVGLDLPKVMDTITRRTQVLTNATGAVLELVEEDEMVYRSVSGSASHQLGLRLKIAASLSGKCVTTGEILRCDDSETDPRVDRDACRKVGARSMIVVPLLRNARAVGVLKVLSKEANTFRDNDVHTLELMAGLITSAMHNAAEAEERMRILSERTHTLQALRESEERYRALAESSFEGVVISKNGILVEVNPRFTQMFGFTASEIAGLDATQLVAEEYRDIVREKINTQSEGPYEVIGLHKNGSTFPLSIKAKMITYHGSQHRVTTMRDITDEKEIERGLVHERFAAERANRLKSEFLATMSHELRTPLNGIIGLSELLLDEDIHPLAENQRGYVRDILQCGEHLLQLINDILDLSKVESGKMEVLPERFTVGAAIQEIEAIVQQLARKKNIEFVVTSSLPSEDVVLDKQKFKQILFNLVSNAVKFTDNRGKVSLHVEPKSHEQFCIAVRDTGIGIKKEDLPKLFQEFQQLESSASRRYQGTGLGLSLTKKLVELMQGTIAVESTIGLGSTFTVTFPYTV